MGGHAGYFSLLHGKVLWVSAKITSTFLSGILDQGAATVGAGGDYESSVKEVIGRNLFMDVENHAPMIDNSILVRFATYRAEIRHLIISYSLIRSS